MANTGYKAWRTLEEYDLETGLATGKTKENKEGDKDYIPPVYDTSTCPLPPPPLGWRSIEPYCEEVNGSNTGYLAYATLEEYNLDTGEATGVTKPNSLSDPDYMAPIYKPSQCPLPDSEAPVFTSQPYHSTGYNNLMIYWGASDNVAVTKQTVYYKRSGETNYTSRVVGATDTGFYLGNLPEGTRYYLYVVACDAENNCTTSNTTSPVTKVRLTQVTLSRSYKSFQPCLGSSGTYYLNGSSIGTATIVYNAADGSSTAPPGYYSDGWYWRYWTGSNWNGNETPCGN